MGEIVEYNPKEDTLNGDNIHHRCHPLHLIWLSGFNPRVSLLNVSTTRDRKELVLASGNTLLFYCYDGEREKIVPVVGHKNVVNMIGSDETGRFVVSSDCSYCINVWDRHIGGENNQHPVAIRTIFEPFKTKGDIGAVTLSWDGKYLLTGGGIASEQGSQLKLWSWTVGNDFPDDTITLPTRLGRIKTIHFCRDRGRRNQFVVTLDSGVVFGAWDSKEQKLSIQVPKRHGFQDYNETVFVECTDRAVSVTGAGIAVLWSNDRKQSDRADGSVLRKEFLKYLHLKYASINVVRSCDEKIVTGDDDGEIRFYDNSMKILYWFKQEDLEPIRTLSFELVETRQRKLERIEPIEGDDSAPNEEPTEKKPEVNIEDIAPKDVSFEARPVIVRGFVSATKSGKIYDIDIVYNKIQELFLQSPSIITAFDVHAGRSELCTCDGNGRFVLYDLQTKSMRLALDVPIQRTRRGRITTLAYSACGTFLAGGAENGYLWMVEPNLLILAGSSPLQFTGEKIRVVLFSEDSKHLICVKMVHYTINSDEMAQLEALSIVKRKRIEQSAFPTAVLILPGGNQILVANDQLKFKIFHSRTFDILHTYLAPFHDGPARYLRLLPGEDYFLFITDNNIYLHHLPIDGNPFKYLAVRGHPKRLKGLQIAWTISPKNSDGDAELTLRDAMNVQDVPNYMRSIGYHMTEYEELNLCKEMELTGTYFLTFEEVTKLFLNHRIATGGPPNTEDIRTAVTYIGATTSSGNQVDLVQLITLLASMGEPMEPKTAEAYCRVLFPSAFEAREQDEGSVAECGTAADCTNLISIDEFADKLC
uniref:Cilia- and flagella-associated protein 251 n=1 Tax=Anopheles culicifacies TaxID=139723 RepID=A0A182M6H8_9DIPT